MGSREPNGMSGTTGADWKALADEYQKTTAEVSIKPISKMLERANALLQFSKATGILDNGCGPGPVMSQLLRDYEIPQSCNLTCADFSEAMIEQVKRKKESAEKESSKSPWARVTPVVQDAMDLKSVEDASVSHVTAGWVYFMVSDPQKALSESRRVLQDGGVLTCSAWEGSQWLDLMNLAPRVRPDKTLPTLPKEWSSAELMKAEVEKAGFRDVECHRVGTEMKFEKLEDMVHFLVTKLPHMVKLTEDFTEDELAQLEEVMVSEGKKMSEAHPGQLHGTSLVAVGRKYSSS